MIKIKCYSTGSEGNGYLVMLDDNNHFLLECGINYFNYRDINWSKIKGIFITHEHTDHIHYLENLINRLPNLPIIATNETLNEYLNQKHIKDQTKYIINRNRHYPLIIDNFTYTMFNTHHDTANPCGFHFKYHDKEIYFITDTGKIPEYISKNKMINNSLILIEANYDNEIIFQHLNLPHNQRTLSDKGHLSTFQCYEWINRQPANNAFYLIHGSKKNLGADSDKLFDFLNTKGYNINRLKNGDEIIW